MSLHDVFTVLCVIAYIVFVALAIYAVISEWAREKGMSRDTLIKRLRSGWELERVLNEPVNKSFSRKSVERRMR